jgi:TorA maturation chaperone TorD
MSSLSTFDEETARAEVYGLLAALFYAPPGAELLAQLRVAVTQAPEEGGVLEESWQAVVAAARERSDQDIASEHDKLFGGVGKPEVYVYASHYLSGFLNEKPLVRLREDLTRLGLTRDESMPETEDHFAYCCEVMRFLIAGEDVSVSNLTQQKAFFGDHVQPWAIQMCDALAAHPSAAFYANVAQFAKHFLEVEQQGFDLLA